MLSISLWQSCSGEPTSEMVNSDVVETVTSETETWLKFQDETETSSKTPIPRL